MESNASKTYVAQRRFSFTHLRFNTNVVEHSIEKPPFLKIKTSTSPRGTRILKLTRLILIMAPFGSFALLLPCVALASSCDNSSFVHSLARVQMMDGILNAKQSSAEECLQACCNLGLDKCTAWQYHVSSTDPTHHPRECWIKQGTPQVVSASSTDVWVGGSMLPPEPAPAPGGGAKIQPLSSWFAYGAGATLANTLQRELAAQSIAQLRKRSAIIASLGQNSSLWAARQAAALRNFSTGPFAPLPPPNRKPPAYTVTKTLTRPGYTCELILYETRPGFYATGAIWTPTNLRKNGGKAPGVLMVSGHTNDGFRSNNRGGNITENDPPDDDYEVYFFI